MSDDKPFASAPAEAAHQAALAAGVTITRDQTRQIVQAFQMEMEKSRKDYERCRDERDAEYMTITVKGSGNPASDGVFVRQASLSPPITDGSDSSGGRQPRYQGN